MARIKIKELSRDLKVSEEEVAKIRGGIIIVNGRRLASTGPDQVSLGGGQPAAVVVACGRIL